MSSTSSEGAPDGLGPRKLLFILNPQAGRGRARRQAASLPGTARALGWDAELWETEYAGHEVELARRAATEGWPLVIAVGGDGTVHGVVNGLMQVGRQSDTTLGHVPIGTGNDFAKTVGLDKASFPERNLERVLSGTRRKLDLGTAAGEYFVNGFGIGFGADVVRNTFEFKRLRGFALYFAAVLRTFSTFETPRLEVETAEHSENGLIMMTEVAIGKTAGGGFKLTPDADPADGLLDVCMIGEVSLLYYLRNAHRLMKGTHTELRPVTVFQTTSVQVESLCGRLPVHLDGELRFPTETSFDVRIEPGRLMAQCAC